MDRTCGFDVDRRSPRTFLQRCPEKCLWSFLWKACTDKSNVGPFAQEHVWMQRRWSELGICVRQVIIETVFVQLRTSPCIYRHLEKQLRVWVEGNDCVSLFYISNVMWFFSKLQELWVVTNRRMFGPSEYRHCVQSIRVLGRIVEWKRILDMPN